MSEEITAYAEKRGISGDKILSERYQVSEADLNVVVPENDQEEVVLEMEPEKAHCLK